MCIRDRLKEAQERQRLENQNRKLLVQVECLEQELEQERSFSFVEGIFC